MDSCGGVWVASWRPYQKPIEVLGSMRAYTASSRFAGQVSFQPPPQKFLDKCSPCRIR